MLTPKRKNPEQILRSARISKENKGRVRRSLYVANVLIEQMKLKGKYKEKEVQKCCIV